MRQLTPVRTFFSKFTWLNWLLLVAVLWLIAAVIVWWYVVYMNPKHVFEGMLRNNFSTMGFTSQTKSNQNGLAANTESQLQLGHQTLIRTLTTLKQQKDTVVTDSISTPDKEYVRYLTIETSTKSPTGNKLDFSSALNKWASSPGTGSSQAVAQAMLGIFPMGMVSSSERHNLLDYLHTHNVFTVKYNDVKKQTIDGRRVYTYDVQLQPQAYVEMLKNFGSAVGLNAQVANLNPSDYAGAQPTALKVSIDAASRHLRSVSFAANAGQNVTYSGYGIVKDVKLPRATITTDELQKRLAVQ